MIFEEFPSLTWAWPWSASVLFLGTGTDCSSSGSARDQTGQSWLSGLLSSPLNWVKKCSANSLFNGNLIIQSSAKNLFEQEPSQGALPVVHWKGICYGVRYYFIPVSENLTKMDLPNNRVRLPWLNETCSNWLKQRNAVKTCLILREALAHCAPHENSLHTSTLQLNNKLKL